MPTTQTRNDPDNIYGWDTIESTFDDAGALTSKLTTYDNGTTRQDDYFPDGYVDPLNIAIGAVGQVSLQTDLPVGDGSLSSWDSILTYYSLTSPTQRLYQQIIDDTDLEKNTTYADDGSVTRVDQIDHGDVKSWDSYTRIYGDDPRETTTQISYDNGDLYEKTTTAETIYGVADGFYTETVHREDISDSQDYVYQTTEHVIVPGGVLDPMGEDYYTLMVAEETLYDDGVWTVFTSNNPEYGGYRQVSTDQNNAYDWATRTEDFRASESAVLGSLRIDGTIVTEFDDGSTQREVYNISDAGGQKAVFVYADGVDISSENTTYDGYGNVTERTTSGLDRVLTVERFENGQRTETVEFDDTYDVKNFTVRGTTYDDYGVIAQRETSFDDGLRQIERFYDTGVRQDKVVTDESDAYNYALKADTYDATGTLVERIIQYDDGRELVDAYVDGNRESRIITDKQDAFDYELKADVYNANGDLENRYVAYDDGRYQTEYFENGVRAAKVTEDHNDAYNYYSKAAIYGADGVLTQRSIEYDDGRTLNSSYEDGLLTETFIEDRGNAYKYTTVNVTYDQDAGLEIRETQYDDGRLRTQVKDDGVVVFVADQDLSADGQAYNYVTRTFLYDTDGSRVQSRTELDTGDEFIFNYTDNAVTRRVDYDGDGSSDWAFKVTDYAFDTPPVVTYYDTIAETPDDIVDDFFLLTM